MKEAIGQAIGQNEGLFGFEPDSTERENENVQPGNLTASRVLISPEGGVNTQAGPRAKGDFPSRSDLITAEVEKKVRAEFGDESQEAPGWMLGAFDRAYRNGWIDEIAARIPKPFANAHEGHDRPGN